MLNKKFCMLGCHEAGYEIIKYLLENSIKIDYFITLTPEEVVKYKISGYFDFKNLANKYKIPIYYPKSYSLKDNEDLVSIDSSAEKE